MTTRPVFTETFGLSGFDGVVDYAGASGGMAELAVSSSVTKSSSAANDLALFSAAGGGAIDLVLDAERNISFSANGAASLRQEILFGALATISYTYLEASVPAAVPEPESLALMCAGMGLTGVMRRRKRLDTI